MKKSVAKQTAILILFQFVCFGAAAIGGAFTATSVRTWYLEIAKPTWTPPSWVFGPVWTILYVLMGVSAWLVWRAAPWPNARVALTLFGVQLVLNTAWSILFFGAQNPGLAFLEILLLWCAIVATIVTFWRHSKTASVMLAPYLCWSSFAAFLNYAIWQMN